MITVSDNDAASTLWDETGRPSLQHFLNLAGMKQTDLGPGGYWGLTQITAHDETDPAQAADEQEPRAHQRRLMQLCPHLMAQVVPSERWGVPAGAPADVTVHVKNGWLPQPTLRLADQQHRQLLGPRAQTT